MIEAAAFLSLLMGHWADLTIILVLLFYNAISGFWQEHKASDGYCQVNELDRARAPPRTHSFGEGQLRFPTARRFRSPGGADYHLGRSVFVNLTVPFFRQPECQYIIT